MILTVFLFLLVFSAFFSGSETAYLSLGRIRLKQVEDSHHPCSKRVSTLLSDRHKLIITILIGNTFVNIAATSLMAGAFYGYFGESGVGYSIGLLTFLILIFGEVTPKMLALSFPVKFSLTASVPLLFFEKVFYPFRFVLDRITTSMVRMIGLETPSTKQKITEQEIRELISIGERKGIVKEKEKDMMYNVLRLNDINAADIMTPRIDADFIDITGTPDEIIRKMKEAQYSRIPVFIHNIDNIIGIIYAKEYLLNPELPLKQFIKKPYFVHESMRVDHLLTALQKRNIHMAIVTDEYGVTSGLVTIEDILEEIVGEISDELDFEPEKIKMIDQKTFDVNGQVHINDINAELGLNIDTEEVDTIGGFVILRLGKIPRAGDVLNMEGYSITVGDVSKNRITNLKIELQDEAGSDNANSRGDAA